MQKMLFLFLVCFFSLASGAQTYQQHVRKAMDCLAMDSVERAKQHFRQAIRLEPNTEATALLHKYMGQIYEHEGEHQNALDSYTKGLHILVGDTALLARRAGLYLLLGNEDRAIADYTEILSKDKHCVEALFFRAYSYTQQRRYPQARKDYEEIIRLDPMHENAHLGLIVLNDKDRRPREAMEGINRLIEYYPRHSHLYLVRAGLEEQRKQYETARHDYDQAIALAPQDAEAYMARATFCLNINDRKQAMADLKQAIKLGADPDEVATLMHQATKK